MTGDEISILGQIFGGLHCRAAFDCNNDLDNYGGILLWFALCFYMFKQLGSICDEYFVPSLEVIVEKLEMSNDVAGATFMAAGSSAPELFTSLVATFFIVNEGGVGTIVGSAIFNILVIVGATGFIACKDTSLKIWWYPLTRDCVFYLISILELMIVLRDDEIVWYEAASMVATYFLYIFYMWLNPRVISHFGFTFEGKDDGKGETAETPTETPSVWQDPIQEVTFTSCSTNQSDAERQENKGSDGTGGTGGPECDLPGIVKNGDATLTVCDCEGDEDLVKPLAAPGDTSSRSAGSDSNIKTFVTAGSMVTENHDGNLLPTVVVPKPLSAPGGVGEEDMQFRPGYVGNTESSSSRAADIKPKPLLLLASSPSKLPRMSMRGSKDDPRTVGVDPVKTGMLSVMPESTSAQDADDCEEPSYGDCPGPEASRRWWSYIRDPCALALETFMPSPQRHWSLFSLSILAIGVATYVMVDSVNRAGTILKVPPMVMGLTVLAAGTSIPDAMGSIAVAKQGEGDMAVANALGSNIFDILIGLGVPWSIRLAMGKTVRFPGKADDMTGDIIILAGVLFLFVGALLLNKWRLSRRVGVVLIAFYFLNILYNILAVYVFETKSSDD